MAQAGSRKSARRSAARPATRSPGREPKYVYSFAGGKAEGSSALRDLLGGKGCELAEMTKMGVPVPPGFTITTEAWAAYDAARQEAPGGALDPGAGASRPPRGRRGQPPGDPARPLLVSVRSGARASMPGMMDTVLNLGLNDRSVGGPRGAGPATSASRGTATAASSRSSATWCSPSTATPSTRGWTPRRRARARRRMRTCPAAALRELVAEFKKVVQDKTGRPFPQDPHEQLRLAINAVFESWWAKKAVDYRRIHRLPDDWGTAVTRDGDGLRQSRADLGHRGVLLARSRRAASAASSASSSSTRRARTWWRASAPPSRSTRSSSGCPRCTPSSPRSRTGSSVTTATCRTSSSRCRRGGSIILQTRSGKRTGAAAVRIAVEMVAGAAHRPEHRAPARGAGLAPPAPREDGGPRRALHRDRHGPARHPGGGGGQGRVRSGEGGGHGPPGRGGHPGARRDLAGGRGGHALGAGRADLARRPHLARGGGGPRLGQVLRGRRGRGRGGRGEPSLPGRPRGRARGAGDHAERRHRRGDRGRPAARGSQALRRVPGAPRLGPGARHHHGPRQRGHPRGRGQGARVRRGGHRPGAHRAHVLRGRAHPDRARDDHGARSARPGRRRSTSSCRSSARTSSASSG